MANITWSPTDLTNVTLSNGNLRATVGSGAGGARGSGGVISGKYYWEYTYTIINTNSIVIGVALASASLTTIGTGAAIVTRSAGSFQVNGIAVGSGTLGIIGQGNVVGIAVDFTAKYLWFRIAPSGNWNGDGTANPATGVGGLDITPISSGQLYPYINGGSSDAVTANFGDTAFTGAAPAGFISGVPATPTTVYVAGEVREVLFAPIPTLAVGGGMAREVLLATATAISFGGVAREILLFGLETTTIGAARYSDLDSVYQATIKLRTNLVASRYIDPDSVYQAIIKLKTNLVASRYIDPDRFYTGKISGATAPPVPPNVVYSYRITQN